MFKFFAKLIACVTLFCTISSFCYANAEGFTIVLDPGHGGAQPGCTRKYNGRRIKEKDLNLKIAFFMREELKNYKTSDGKEINVYLTRENDNSCPSLPERVEIAASKNANVLISLHNNAKGGGIKQCRGAMVLVTSSNYNNLYHVEEGLAISILSELRKIGISSVKNGLLRRLSRDGSVYPNGNVADWYGIVKNGVLRGIPSIILEHAYLDNIRDYKNFLCTDSKLKNLAIADVKGIVQYYNLVRK